MHWFLSLKWHHLCSQTASDSFLWRTSVTRQVKIVFSPVWSNLSPTSNNLTAVLHITSPSLQPSIQQFNKIIKLWKEKETDANTEWKCSSFEWTDRFLSSWSAIKFKELSSSSFWPVWRSVSGKELFFFVLFYCTSHFTSRAKLHLIELLHVGHKDQVIYYYGYCSGTTSWNDFKSWSRHYASESGWSMWHFTTVDTLALDAGNLGLLFCGLHTKDNMIALRQGSAEGGGSCQLLRKTIIMWQCVRKSFHVLFMF